ncbi:MAG: HD domain-containing protein [Candidatus Helarchaeota archaeon]
MSEELISYLEDMGFEKTSKIISEITLHPIFKRLKGISYLGTFKFVFSIQEDFSRYVHCLDTALLLSRVLIKNGISESEALPIIVSGLLHDVGHVFFSHVGEQAIFFNHEIHAKYIIDTFLRKLLSKISFTSKIFYVTFEKNRLLLNSQLDCDTLCGIERTGKSLSLKIPDLHLSLPKYLINEDKKWYWKGNSILKIGDFWMLKRLIYRHFVYHPSNQACEVMLQSIIKKLRIKNAYFEDEDIIRMILQDSEANKIYYRILQKDFFQEITLPRFFFPRNPKKLQVLKRKFNLESKIMKKTYRKIFLKWKLQNLENEENWLLIESFLNKFYKINENFSLYF